jgi:hypothetical protein
MAAAEISPDNVPRLISPTEGEVMDNGGGTPVYDPMEWSFAWSAVRDASSYEWALLSPTGMTPYKTVAVSDTQHTESSRGWVPGTPPPPRRWSVRAMVNGQWQPWGTPRLFNLEERDADILADFQSSHDAPAVNSLPPEKAALVPRLLAPTANAVLDNAVAGGDPDLREWQFQWAPVADATLYQLVVRRPDTPGYKVFSAFETPGYELYAGDVISSEQLSGWIYRVRAKVGGQWQPWSDAVPFSVEPQQTDRGVGGIATSPSDPRLIPTPKSPADGQILLDTSPSAQSVASADPFRWGPVPGASRYHLFVNAEGATAAFINATTSYDYINPGTRPLSVPPGTPLRWKIRAMVNGQWQGWSPESSFSYRHPSDPPRPGTALPTVASAPSATTARASGAAPAATSPPASSSPNPKGSQAWTDSSGRVVTAEFVGIQGGSVMLLVGGRSVPVPLNRLSAESQTQARRLAAAMPPDTKVAVAGANSVPATPAPLATSSGRTGENLLLNADFSMSATGDTIPQWERAKATCIVKDDEGRNVLRLTSGSSMARQTVNLPEGCKRVKLEFKIRLGVPGTATWELFLAAPEDSGNVITKDGRVEQFGTKSALVYDRGTTESKGWKTIRAQERVPQGATQISVTLFSTGTGATDFSDLELTATK